MDDGIQKSCWGTTAWAVAAFACVMALIYLTGMPSGADVASVLPK